MDRPRRAARAVLASVALLASAACGQGGGRKVDRFAMEDITPPSMFLELAFGLRKAHVFETQKEPVHHGHDLTMEDTTEREVLERIRELDPRYQYALREDVLLYWPTGEDEARSPWSKRIPEFRAEGGVATVLQKLIVEAGLQEQVTLQLDRAGRSRPVSVDLRDPILRDVVAEVARQAHLGMRMTPYTIHGGAIPE